MAFAACGLIAGAISFAIFDSAPDPDPRDAMALAPAQALTETKVAPAARLSENEIPPAQTTGEEGANASHQKTGSIKPACRESAGETRQGDCAPVRVVRIRPARAANERPLIAAVPIGHRDDPTMRPASPQTAVGAGPVPVAPEEPKVARAPTEISLAEQTPAETPPAVEPAPPASNPAVAAQRSRPRVHHASRRRNENSYSSSSSGRSSRSSVSRAYAQFGYARLW